MPEVWVGLGGLLGAGFATLALRRRLLRRSAVERLFREEEDAVAGRPPRPSIVRVPCNAIAAGAGAAALALATLVLALPGVLSAAVGVVCGIVAWVGARAFEERRAARLERQLADAIDLMVASLRAGAGVTEALGTAASESRPPIAALLREAVTRLRYGDDPREVMGDLSRLAPLESFRLFALTHAVHWEVGGSLAATLSLVGRFVRDRLQVRRTIRTQSAHARVAVTVVIAMTWLIALFMWSAAPGRMEYFVSTDVGRIASAGAVILQAVGVLWVTALSRIRY